ncbi:hypothetical protein [Burkholderia gladioli]|uniref:hypothetical protein n=1 Tax=Burkholderia gladioli TaxID=28095 RepID=UPI00163EB695|nr:hypothetical protein [Burkholderia gladioli]
MQRDANLVKALLAYLQGIEALKKPEEQVLVQPHYEEVTVPNGFGIDGYTGQQIDDHLRLMLHDGLIVGQEVGIGIYLEHLTKKGRALLNDV